MRPITVALRGVLPNGKPTVANLQVAVADNPNVVPTQQLSYGRACESVELALPVVIVQQACIPNFLLIPMSGVAHQLVDSTRLQSRDSAFQIAEVELATLLQAEEMCGRHVRVAAIDRL
jgi:hypothetical protein